MIVRMISKEMIWRIVAALFAGMALFSCGKSQQDPGGTPSGPEDDNQPVVVVLDQKERPTVDEIKPDGTVVFAGTGMSDKLKPGTVICSEPAENAPRGFLYKVKSVSMKDGNTVVTTEQACLEDAIEKCHVSETFDLRRGIESIEFGDGTLARPVPANDTRAEVSAGVKLPFKIKVKGDKVYFRSSPEDLEIIETDPNDEDLEVIEYVGDDLKGSASVAAEIAVTVEFKLTMGVELDMEDWSVQHFAFWAQPEFKAEADAGFVLEGKMDFKDIKICKISMTPITIMAGVVPVVFTPSIGLYADVTASGKIKFKTKLLDLDFKYKVGVDYSNDKWTLINENTSKDPSFLELDKQFKVTLEGDLEVEPTRVTVIPGLYNVDTEGSFYAGVGVPFKLAVTDFDVGALFGDYYVNPKIKATWAVNPLAKAKLTVLKHDLIDFNPKFTLISGTIFEKNVFPVMSDLGMREVSSTTASTEFSLKEMKKSFVRNFLDIGVCYSEVNGGDTSLQMFGDGNRYTSLGAGLYWDKNDAEEDIDISLMIEGLTPSTGYYVRPFFATRLGVKYGRILHFVTAGNSFRVYTQPVTDITDKTAVLHARVESGGTVIREQGFCLSAQKTVPTKEDSELPLCMLPSGSSSCVVRNLTPDTKYYVRAFATSDQGTVYGSVVEFTTLKEGGDPGGVQSVSLDKTELELGVGHTATLVATVSPENAANKKVTWSSNKESVATVTSNGVVKGIAPGVAIITVTTQDGGKTASCKVTVKESYILHDPVPEDGAKDVDLHVNLSCSGHLYDQGENNFEVRISKNPDMSSVLKRVRHTGPSVYAVSFDLEGGTTYYWQVAEFDFEKEAWVIVSPIWHFTTRNAPPEPKLSVSTKKLDFGDQIKFTQKTRDITISNSGTGSLEITSISKTNNYGDLFQLSGWTSGGTIAAGASKTITVSFQPVEERYYEETLTIVSSNSVTAKTATVTLCGTGIPEPEDAVIQISVDELTWGEVEVGERDTQSFSVKNTGSTALTINSIQVVATDNTVNPSYFSVSPNSSFSLSPGKSTTFSVVFAPEAVRSYSAMLSIKSNASNATQGTSTVWLSGEGVAATSKVLSASPASLSFGYQTIGNRTHKNFTVTNTGTKAVTLYSMVATDGFIVDQTWADGNSLGLAAGASKTFSAYFAPTQVKSYSGEITIKSNASSGDLVIPLSGIGEEAQGYLEITSGESLDFGNVNVGTSGTLYARIRNTGEAPLNILGIDCPEGFSASCSVTSMKEGSNATVSVSFTPTQAKAYRGSVIVNTDAENGSVSINVSGTGKQGGTGNTFVDMGLSVKWASANVGAANPEDYGHYVAWAETGTKTQYLEKNYKYYDINAYYAGEGYITKYCSNSKYGYQGYHDNLRMLTYDDDYAQAKCGGLVRIPTRKEWEELKSNCTWVWTSQNGVHGFAVTSDINGNTIFLPAGGLIDYSNDDVNSVGYYWASDLYHDDTYAYTWELRSDKAWYSYRERYKGLTIRAVEDVSAKPMIDTDKCGLTFAGVRLGTTARQTLTVKNIGKGTLHISGIRSTKRIGFDWTSASIEPGASKVLTVTYTPVDDPNLVIDDPETWDMTTMTISSDARNSGEYTLSIKGYGIKKSGNIEGTEEDPWN